MSDGQHHALERIARAQAAPHRLVRQAQALLLAADGVATTAIAARVGVSPTSVGAWRARFVAQGLSNFGSTAIPVGPARAA